MKRQLLRALAFATATGITALLGLAAPAASLAADEAPWPSKPLRMMIPYPAGGSTDIVARLVTTKLSEALKQQVIPDNRGGAGGLIATETAARAVADGYTLLFGTSAGLVIAPLINSKITYDPVRDFDPVSLIVTNPQILVVNNALKVNSVRELIEAAKKSPGKIFYASAGIGAPNHIATEWLKSLVGVNMVHVPFKGVVQAMPDLLEDRVQMLFNTIPGVLPYVKSGKLKALAVTTARRSNAVPDVPTMGEAGVANFEYDLWWGLFVPAKSPAPIVARLNAELVKMLAVPEVIQGLANQGAEARSSTPAELARIVRTDYERLGKVIKSANITAD